MDKYDIADIFLAPLYKLSGKKPFKLGYQSYKRRKTRSTILNKTFSKSHLAPGYGFRIDERIIEYPWAFSEMDSNSEVLLDAGSTLNYWYLLQNPLLKNKKIMICTLAPERRNYSKSGINYIFEDLRQSCLRDRHFDTIVCLSTIEHVGMDNALLYSGRQEDKEYRPDDYLMVLREFNRILKPGGKLLLSFPFGARDLCGWYQVFDSESIHKMLTAFAPSSVEKNIFSYIDNGWSVSSEEDCKDAETFDIHTTKSYTYDYLAFSRAVCCMKLIK